MDLAPLRRRFAQGLTALLGVIAALTAVIVWLEGHPAETTAISTALVCAGLGAALLAGRVGGWGCAAQRDTIAVAVMGIIAIHLALGAPAWQMHLHMAFFPALALLARFCCPRTMLVGAGAVALHHLGLNLLAPRWSSPTGRTCGASPSTPPFW